METSIEELRELGLMPSDETVVAARESREQQKRDEAAAQVEAARQTLADAEAALAAVTPVVEEVPTEEAAETPAEEQAEGEVQG